jgi:hypothetical protein
MRKSAAIIFAFIISQFQAQQGAYYQQAAKYRMDIDVNAEKFTYQGKQTLEYTNNSPDELNVVYFHLYWNAFKPNSMMDQRVASQGKMETQDCRKTVFQDWLLFQKIRKELRIFTGLNKMVKI